MTFAGVIYGTAEDAALGSSLAITDGQLFVGAPGYGTPSDGKVGRVWTYQLPLRERPQADATTQDILEWHDGNPGRSALVYPGQDRQLAADIFGAEGVKFGQSLSVSGSSHCWGAWHW